MLVSNTSSGGPIRDFFPFSKGASGGGVWPTTLLEKYGAEYAGLGPQRRGAPQPWRTTRASEWDHVSKHHGPYLPVQVKCNDACPSLSNLLRSTLVKDGHNPTANEIS